MNHWSPRRCRHPVPILLTGMPVAFTLAGPLVCSWLGIGEFAPKDFGDVPANIFGNIIEREPLTAVPFILLGLILEKTGIASAMLQSTERLAACVVVKYRHCLGRRGRCHYRIVGATVVTMAVLSLPTMLPVTTRNSAPALSLRAAR